MDLKTYLKTNTQTDLAHRLGVTQGLVHQWATGKTRITAERAVEIEKATDSQITRQELRPEIFGHSVPVAVPTPKLAEQEPPGSDEREAA